MASVDSTSSSLTSSSFESHRKRMRANEEDEEVSSGSKRPRFVIPPGFLEPLNSMEILAPVPISAWKPDDSDTTPLQVTVVPKQFWKAGDYEESLAGRGGGGETTLIDGMDHVRVHPRFLHSNATSHKWVLGAVAELLDNSLDEVNNGATYCNIDMVLNKKDGSRMLLVEDNGGGMSPGTMRHCMSLGYSAKSKLADTIGQYGNGFKTSTMRVGADVIVFSRCPGKDGRSPTQSIGLLSYTFLTSTGKEDIVVPMLDYERNGKHWSKIVPESSSSVDWNKKLETIVQWSPYASEADLLEQFNHITDQGTRIIIYNLWEDEQGALELDFDSDIHDIQIRGVNRDEKKIQMAKDYPNSRICLTYTHSLRSYSSILYLRRPQNFRIILRGKDVVQHNIVSDMSKIEDIKYKPKGENADMGVVGKMGFHKDAKAHLDIQGFNVYHRNRLIKPFWRVWNTPSSGGRGVIGLLEANFVKPAHDKQDFERTNVLSRLESKLAKTQKRYWYDNKGAIGYADPKQDNPADASAKAKARAYEAQRNLSKAREIPIPVMEKCNARSNHPESDKRETVRSAQGQHWNGHMDYEGTRASVQKGKDSEVSHKEKPVDQNLASKRNEQVASKTSVSNLMTENREPNDRMKRTSDALPSDLKSKQDRAGAPLEDQIDKPPQADSILVHGLQEENRELKEKCRSLEAQLKEANDKFESLKKEQNTFLDIFAEERIERDAKEDNLNKKIKDASNTIYELKVKVLNLERKKRSLHIP
ncbi:hypothetical protein MKW94_021927 [Papaver nudicaule]|uniref:Morc S5 domain-containing protein n=1 Tax=Papaver nudicaule TaxID=74823 RepID=A0AA41S383_PAPNU|nr:hypothetical protein [Papaver nudicaule]